MSKYKLLSENNTNSEIDDASIADKYLNMIPKSYSSLITEKIIDYYIHDNFKIYDVENRKKFLTHNNDNILNELHFKSNNNNSCTDFHIKLDQNMFSKHFSKYPEAQFINLDFNLEWITNLKIYKKQMFKLSDFYAAGGFFTSYQINSPFAHLYPELFQFFSERQDIDIFIKANKFDNYDLNTKLLTFIINLKYSCKLKYFLKTQVQRCIQQFNKFSCQICKHNMQRV